MSSTFNLLRLRVPMAARMAPATRSMRPVSYSARLLARKDVQGKDEMKIEPNEYSKSDSDSAAAGGDTAFDPKSTTPEEQSEQSKSEGGSEGGDPLESSPANHEFSKPRDQQEGGHEGSSAQSGQGPSDRARTSGKGSPNKAGK